MATSPNVLNYFIGKGIVKFTPAGGVQRDLGNAPEVEVTPEIEKLEHKSSRAGISSVDFTAETSVKATLRVVLDEITAENLALQLLGEVVDLTDGSKTFEILSQSAITGQIDFTGTNDVGNQVAIIMPEVKFAPSGSLNLISDDFGQIELTGDVLVQVATDGSRSFGTVTVVG